MTNKLLFTLLIILYTAVNGFARNNDWQRVSANQVFAQGSQKLHPDKYETYALNTGHFQSALLALPSDPATVQVIELPVPGGDFRNFRVWETPVMEEGLAKRYP